ncbi:DUF1648 domain-containing protein [Chryseobacterium schmidteae]|uniref:DUF1648 domain-containing protein n=1 Tax=Chryseobacterium schmidteae TaxID=2730404 RepID=UPI00158A57E9|nr:DUF1648 domain-containing protein [Chryseobacterium schmidteae]
METVILTVFDILNVVLILFLWVYTLRIFKKLPEKIPTHFDFEGKPDHFRGKRFAFFLPVLSIIFYVVFFFITKYPETGNFPVEITEANQKMQFLIMIFLLKWLLFLVLLMFLNIQDYTIRYSLNSDSKARVHILLFIPFIFISVMAAIISTYIYK